MHTQYSHVESLERKSHKPTAGHKMATLHSDNEISEASQTLVAAFRFIQIKLETDVIPP